MRRKILAGVLLAAMSLTTIVSDGADAWERTRLEPGRLGRVSMPDISYAPIYVTTAYGQTAQLHVLSDDRPRIRRAKVKGRQRVHARYVLQRWNGSQWADHTVSRTYRRSYEKGQRFTRIPQFVAQVGPTTKGGPRGYWRLSLVLVWAKGSRTLGGMAVLPSDYGDQKCLRRGMQCVDYGQWLYVHNVAYLVP